MFLKRVRHKDIFQKRSVWVVLHGLWCMQDTQRLTKYVSKLAMIVDFTAIQYVVLKGLCQVLT